MFGRIFLPSGKTCLARGPYILSYLLLHVIFFILFFCATGIPVLPLLLLVLYNWVKININAQRLRDSGQKGRYMVILSVLAYLVAIIVASCGFVRSEDCMLLGVRIYFGFDAFVFFILILAPGQLKTTS